MRLTARFVPARSRSDGFGDTATLEGDPAAATAHLKAMTSKMAESKRLIKEYERVAVETEGADPDAVAARKKEMVQKLNAYVNKKKAAQADIAARVASTAAAVGVPAALSLLSRSWSAGDDAPLTPA